MGEKKGGQCSSLLRHGGDAGWRVPLAVLGGGRRPSFCVTLLMGCASSTPAPSLDPTTSTVHPRTLEPAASAPPPQAPAPAAQPRPTPALADAERTGLPRGPSASGDCAWAIHGHPSESLAHVHTVALYLRPPGAPVHAAGEGWAAKQASILRACAAFHMREYPGSLMTWSLHGPLELPAGVPGGAGEGEAAANCAYELCQAAAEAAVCSPGALPPPSACHAPWAPAGGAPPPPAPLPSLPTILPVLVFLDHGCEDTALARGHGGRMEKYYVHAAAARMLLQQQQQQQQQQGEAGAAAAPLPTPEAVCAWLEAQGIARAGGSRASYSGTRLPRAFGGLWSALGLLQGPPGAGTATPPPMLAQPQPAPPRLLLAPPEHLRPLRLPCPTLAPIAWGVGVVTVEAWGAPGVQGSDCVAYHEGLGHTLNLPHPAARRDDCVMSHAQYNRGLMEAVICGELKRACVSVSGAAGVAEAEGRGGGGTASATMPLAWAACTQRQQAPVGQAWRLSWWGPWQGCRRTAVGARGARGAQGARRMALRLHPPF